jgi:hypothetical protein
MLKRVVNWPGAAFRTLDKGWDTGKRSKVHYALPRAGVTRLQG